MIGLCGAHRCGKTTLAREYADRNHVPFVETSVSAIFRELGYDPAVTYDFETRMTIQEEILVRIDKRLGEFAGTEFITDRTPIDMAAYLLAEAVGDSVPDHVQYRVERYVAACFGVTNRRFGVIVLVQPGIQLVHEEGKAAMNTAYIEHLNSLMLGLSCDERLHSANFYLPRATTDLGRRIKALEASVARSKQAVSNDYENRKAQGDFNLH